MVVVLAVAAEKGEKVRLSRGTGGALYTSTTATGSGTFSLPLEGMK